MANIEAQQSAIAEGGDYKRIDLWGIGGRLWRQGKVTFLVCVAGGLLVGIIAAHVIPRRYALDMSIMPVQSSDESGGSLTSRVAQLALGGSATPATFDAFQALLTSDEVAQKLESQYGVMRRIFAAQWDESAHRWREPGGLLSRIKDGVKYILGFPAWHPPTTADLAGYLKENLSIATTGQRAIKHVGIVVEDPKFGVFLLEALRDTADNVLKDRQRIRSQAQVGYLERQLGVVTVAEHRQVLASLLAENERTLMLMNPATPLAAEVVEHPVVPPAPNSPRPLLVLMTALALGVGLFAVLAMLGRFPLDPPRP